MAPRIGLEPITKWLTATYSTIELPRNKKNDVVLQSTLNSLTTPVKLLSRSLTRNDF